MKIFIIKYDCDIPADLLKLINQYSEIETFDRFSYSKEKLEISYPRLVIFSVQEVNDEIIERIKEIKNIFPDLAVLIMNSGGMTDAVLTALKAGAVAYCPVSDSPESINTEIIEIINGAAIMPAELAEQLNKIINLDRNKSINASAVFTSREITLLGYIRDLLSYEQIAAQLGVHQSRIKFIIRNIYRKIHSIYNIHNIAV